jgi:hypothetical protein
MQIFTDHITEWIIGLICSFSPIVLALILKKTKDIPEITIPFWFFCMLICALPSYFVVKNISNKTQTIRNKSFGMERVVVDGKIFENCYFHKTVLVYQGKEKNALINCTIDGPTLSFEDHAGNTIDLLSSLYSLPPYRPVIESLIKREIIDKGLQKEATNNTNTYNK